MLVLETHFLNFAQLSWCKEETIIKVVELCVMVPLMQQNFSSDLYWLSPLRVLDISPCVCFHRYLNPLILMHRVSIKIHLSFNSIHENDEMFS